MATTKYNPYNAVKKISELKGNYHTQKELGGDYKQYQQNAIPYYNELADNGYSAVADELSLSDYTKSLDILRRFKPDDEFEVDTVYDSLIGKMSSSPLPSGGSSTSSDDILERLYSPEWEKQYSGIMNTAADIASGKTAPKTSDAVQSILDSFGRTDDLLNGKLKVDKDGNVIGGLNIDHYNEGKSQLDRINNFDYTKESYFDPIMGTYKLKGEDAAKGELAGGAASNSGNIDSYAAANANRQQLAFTNAGHEAARAAAQQNHDNWQKLYDSMGGHLTEMGAINSENLGTAANMHATDSAERQNAMKTAAGLAYSEAVRRAEAYLAKLADDTTRYGIDADILKNRENNAATLANSEATRQLEKYLAELTDSTNRYGIDAEVGMNREDNAAALEQLMAEIGAQLQMNADDNATTRYGVDAEVGMNSANNQAALEQLLKTIEAEGSMNDADNETEIQKILMQIQGGGGTPSTEKTGAANLSNVANFVQTAIDDIGNGNGIDNLYDVRQAAIEMFGAGEIVVGWIDEAIQNYVKYAGKGKNGLPLSGGTDYTSVIE